MPILHPARSLTALVPRYVSRFSCIGASCEDSCCSGWQISIDKKTYDAYRQSSHPVLKPLFEAKLVRHQGKNGDADYGRVRLDESASCPLMQERLCSVQKHLDESHLSDTCFDYPRATRRFAGEVEQSLTLSCPEAARQALLHADAFDFVKHDIMLRANNSATVAPAHGLDTATMNEVRIFCFQLMRTAGLALWEKLALLGVFCESLSQAIAANKQETVPALIGQCIDLLESGSVSAALQDMRPNHAVQASLFAALWSANAYAATSSTQRAIFEMMLEGMATDAADRRAPLEQITARYVHGLARLETAMRAAPHLLEHCVLNEMFSDLFPFGAATPYEHYRELISRFGMLRFMLAILCGGEGPLPTPALLVQAVQVFCRRVQHDTLFATQTGEALRNRGWDKLEEIYSFLRY